MFFVHDQMADEFLNPNLQQYRAYNLWLASIYFGSGRGNNLVEYPPSRLASKQKRITIRFSDLSIEALSIIFSFMDVAFFQMLYSKEALLEGR